MPSPTPGPERSALDDLPSAMVPVRPSVSLLVPVLNEIAALQRLVADLAAQDYPALREILFVDGGSTDGTREALLPLSRIDPRIVLLPNPRRSTAAALNLALAHATGDVVMRLDAHARYGRDVVRLCVETLLRTGAGGVGMLQRPAPATTVVGRAIVAAHRSPFGIGVASFRREGSRGWVPSIWNGCYWGFVAARAGAFREDLGRAEDNDFNARIRALGYGLYVTPHPQAFYHPRRTLPALARQAFGNGRAVVRALFDSRGAVGAHHFAPLALVLGLGLPLAAASVWPLAGLAALGAGLAYLGVLAVATLLAARTEPGPHLVLLPATLATLHLSYGLGSVLELARRARTGTARPSGTGRMRDARP